MSVLPCAVERAATWTWTWRDAPGVDPEALALALPLVGIVNGLGTETECVLPDCSAFGARVSPVDLFYRCPSCLPDRPLRVVEVFAAQRHHTYAADRERWTMPQPPGPTLAAVWWGRLFVDAGVLSLDLPGVELASDLADAGRMAEHAATVLDGLLVLQGVHSQGGARVPLPTEFARPFAAAWCGLHPMIAYRALQALADGGYVTRDKTEPTRARWQSWRYQLTGRGLDLTSPGHLDLVTLNAPEAPPA